MATPIKYYQVPGGAQGQYFALPYAGNDPQGYTPVSYEEFKQNASPSYYQQAISQYPQIGTQGANATDQNLTLVNGVPMTQGAVSGMNDPNQQSYNASLKGNLGPGAPQPPQLDPGSPNPYATNPGALNTASTPTPEQQSRFQQGFAKAKSDGTGHPDSAPSAKGIIDSYTPNPLPELPPHVQQFFSTDQYINQLISDRNAYMSTTSQQQSLTQQYSKILQDTGLQQIDTSLINMQNLMNGSNLDVRNEITKAGGFATESQIQALTDARNQQLLLNYNSLVALKTNKEQYLNTYMGFAQQDRQSADNHMNSVMQFDAQIANFGQQAQQYHDSKILTLVGQIGLKGLLQSTNGDPHYQSMVEQSLGLPQGGLAAAANAPNQQQIDNLQKYITTMQAQGLDTSAATQQLQQLLGFGGGTASGSYNPSSNYSTANDGNPLNITLGSATQQYVDNGQATVKTANGLKFLSFKDPSVGLQAGKSLLFNSGIYSNLTVDQALKKWSGGSYGANIISGINPNAKISSLSQSQKDNLVNAMSQREGSSTSSSPGVTAAGTTGSSSINSSTPGYATKTIPGAGNLTQAAIDQAAMKYALTGTMPSIGLSSTGQGGLRKNAILNRAGELEGAGNIEGNKVKLASLSTSLGQQTTYLNTMERSVNTVDDNLQILMSAADKVNKADSPLVNEWTNLAKSKVIGSGDLAAYKAAIQTVRTEYSNILSRGGIVTDSQRGEAKNLIPDNITKSQLQQVIGVLKAEGSNVKQEAQNQVDTIAGQINNIVAPSSAGSSSGDYDSYLKSIGQ